MSGPLDPEGDLARTRAWLASLPADHILSKQARIAARQVADARAVSRGGGRTYVTTPEVIAAVQAEINRGPLPDESVRQYVSRLRKPLEDWLALNPEETRP